jgi:predicted nucleotidyltransferase
VFKTVIAYEKQATHISEDLVKKLGNSIESVVLYGSAARNEPHKDSDIDMLIITRKDDSKL